VRVMVDDDGHARDEHQAFYPYAYGLINPYGIIHTR
jgi:hypothetical protein